MIVKLMRNPESQQLTIGQLYAVIGIEADDYRIVDDAGQPYLFNHEWFEVIDTREPAEWKSETGADGERYAYPAELNAPGFFEDFHDGDPEAIATFWRTVNKHLASAG